MPTASKIHSAPDALLSASETTRGALDPDSEHCYMINSLYAPFHLNLCYGLTRNPTPLVAASACAQVFELGVYEEYLSDSHPTLYSNAQIPHICSRVASAAALHLRARVPGR